MRRSERKYDKAHTSQCLTGWPSGPGRDSASRGTHLAGLVLWQISLKMGVRLQYITMQDSGLVSQNDFTHLFHYLLQKMTPCPEESRDLHWSRPQLKLWKGEHLKECRFHFLRWVAASFFFSLSSQKFSLLLFVLRITHGPGLMMQIDLDVPAIKCAERRLLTNVAVPGYQETSNETGGNNIFSSFSSVMTSN